MQTGNLTPEQTLPVGRGKTPQRLFSIAVAEDVLLKLKQHAAENERSVAYVIRRALADFVERVEHSRAQSTQLGN